MANWLQNSLPKTQDTALESFLTHLQVVAISQLELAGKKKLRKFGPAANSMDITCELIGNADPQARPGATESESAS